MDTLKVILSEGAKEPTRGTPLAAGLDLYCMQTIYIPAGGKDIVDTGVTIELPPDTYGRVAGRSGASYRHHLVVAGGVVDCDYRNTIKIIVFNLGDKSILLERGKSIAQLIIERIYTPTVEIVNILSETERKFQKVLDSVHTKPRQF